MKQITSLLITIGLAAFCCGCKTTTSQQQIATASALAYEAAYVGTALDLSAHPEHRKGFELGLVALSGLLKSTNYTSAELVAALNKLPLKELQGENGAIVIGAIVSVFDLARNLWIDTADQPAWVAAVGGSIERGIRDALSLAPSKLKKQSTKSKRFVIPKRA
jgi:hypothetical protein